MIAKLGLSLAAAALLGVGGTGVVSQVESGVEGSVANTGPAAVEAAATLSASEDAHGSVQSAPVAADATSALPGAAQGGAALHLTGDTTKVAVPSAKAATAGVDVEGRGSVSVSEGAASEVVAEVKGSGSTAISGTVGVGLGR